MPRAARGRESSGCRWEHVAPPRPPPPTGGRPFADDASCFAGGVSILRNGRRRRHRGRSRARGWDDAQTLAPAELAAGQLRADSLPARPVPWPPLVLADRAYDPDPLRELLTDDGFALVARHRSNCQNVLQQSLNRLMNTRRVVVAGPDTLPAFSAHTTTAAGESVGSGVGNDHAGPSRNGNGSKGKKPRQARTAASP